MPDARGKKKPPVRSFNKHAQPLRLLQELPDIPVNEHPLYTQIIDWTVEKRLGHFMHREQKVMLLKAKLQGSVKADQDLTDLWIMYYPSHIKTNERGGRDLLALRAKIVAGPPKAKV